jgi:ligand-binding sensor domain-containing protein/two-component sensor histidine kinase
MRISKTHKLFLLWYLFSVLLFAQEKNIKFKRISIEDGLSQSIVEAIIQDHQGFMWFGTEDGLNRYDGYTFTVFKHDPDDTNSISNNNIWCLYEDSKNFLWIGTYTGGLNRYDPHSETFERYLYDPLNPNSISSNKIRSITEDFNGNIWIGTRDAGINRFNYNDEKFIRIFNDPDESRSLSSNNVRFVYPDSKNNLWIATSKGICVYDLDNGNFTKYKTEKNKINSVCDNNVRHIYEDQFGIFWISTAKGLSRFNINSGQFINYLHNPENPKSISSNSIRKVYEDQQGHLWIATTRGGLNEFNRKESIFFSYSNVQTDPNSLSNNSVRVICEDHSGLLWIGTFGGGLNIYNPRTNRFRLYEHNPTDTNSLSHPIVWTISQGPQGNLWFGTNSGGLDRFIRKTGQYISYRHDQNDPFSLGDNHIRTVFWDRSGVLWIGSRYKGVNYYSKKEKRFYKLQHDPQKSNSLSNDNVRSIYEDDFGNLWFCTWGGGLDHYNRITNTFTNFRHLPGEENSLSDNNVISIYQDSERIYWVATSNGLNMLTFSENSAELTSDMLANPKFTRIYHDPSNPKSLSNNYVLSIHESKNNEMWFGTMLGLSRLRNKDYHKPIFSRYFIKNGLPNDVVYGILEDSKGFLWLSTNNGLSRFDPKIEKFKNYDIRDGLQSNEFNSGAYTKTIEGSLIFGGVKGANEFYPDSLYDNPYLAPIVITGFNVYDQPVSLPQALTTTKEIILSYEQNYFSFEFAALDFATPGRNQYAYKLEGLDNSWINSGTRRFAGYTGIDPGEYLFKVKGTNGDGVWNEKATSIRIIILPPYWKTWWFNVLLFLLIGGGITFLIMYRVRQLLKIKTIEKLAEEKMRSKVAADFHDELGNRITKISLFSEILKTDVNTTSEKTREYLNKINENASNLYNETRDFIWHLDPQKDSLHDLAIRLKTFGDELFDSTNTNFEFNTTGENIKIIRLQMDWRQHILRIFKEAMHNALKYAESTNVKLKISTTDSKAIIELTDDGKGFDLSEKSPGEGLNNMKNRAEAIKSELNIQSSPEKGTSVRLIFDLP